MAGVPPSNGQCTSVSVFLNCKPCSMLSDSGRCSEEAPAEPRRHVARAQQTVEGGACVCSLIPDGTTCPVCIKALSAQRHERRPPLSHVPGGGCPSQLDNRTWCHNTLVQSLDLHGGSPESLYTGLLLISKLSKGRPLQRLHSWLDRARRNPPLSSPGTSSPDGEGVRASFLPTHLPLPPAEVIASLSGTERASETALAHRSAWLLTEWLVCIYNYFEMRCAKSSRVYQSYLGPWKVSAQQEKAVFGLYHRLIGFCKTRAGDVWTRGRKTLLESLKELESRNLKPGDCAQIYNRPPKPVLPERVSLPERAGLCSPENYLCAERARVYRDLEKIILPEESWRYPIPKPCMFCSKTDERFLRKLLVGSGMAELVLEDAVPCDNRGRKLLAGLFAVEHKPTSDRMIVDRRPQNCTERRLGWAQLPHGTMLCHLRLQPWEDIRASGFDISNFFYNLKNPRCWRKRTAFGRVFSGNEALELGGDPEKRYHLALRVWGMGDLNSVDVAQCTHEGILESGGAFSRERQMVYGRPLPRQKVFQGIYIDDHLIFGVVPRSRVNDPEAADDTEVVAKTRSCYEGANLPISEKKCFTHKTDFTAWGTEVSSTRGACGAPAERRLQLLLLTLLALSVPTCTKEALQSLLGSLIHPFMHHKSSMCLLGRAFRFVQEAPSDTAVKIPADVCDELLACALSLAVASTDIRAPVCTRVTCSDATPTSLGTVESTVSRELAESLFDHAEQKGAYTRLDWGSLHYELHPWEHSRLPPNLLHAVKSIPWKVAREVDLRETKHVNLTEAMGVKLVLKDACSRSLDAERLVNGTDSRVVLGAFAKGRSSSSQLNAILRSCLGWSVLGQKQICQFWLESEDNPADDPSRHAPLRRPVEPSPVFQHLLIPELPYDRSASGPCDSTKPLCLETFAGRAGLSKALVKAGLPVDTPLEAYPNKGTYIPLHDIGRPEVASRLKRGIDNGEYSYIHFGLPCSSFSSLRRLSGGTRRKGREEGDGTSEKEIIGNHLAQVTAELCWRLHRKGGHFSIENPKGSYAWGYAPLSHLLAVGFYVDFDQCMYGLVPPHLVKDNPTNLRIKKPTRILTNMTSLRTLERTCDKTHKHFECMGSVLVNGKRVSVAASAGRYPPRLCSRWAAGVAAQAGARDGDGTPPEQRPPPRGLTTVPRAKLGL